MCDRKVHFGSNNYSMILSNLIVSDQIISFDEQFIREHHIDCLFNCSQDTPFIIDFTENHRSLLFPKSKKRSKSVKSSSSQNSSSSSNSDSSGDEISTRSNETIIQTLNTSLEWIFQRLALNKKVLVYCENGIQKASIILICFLMKYYNKGTVLDIEKAIHFIESKMSKQIQSKYFSYVYMYHDYLVKSSLPRRTSLPHVMPQSPASGFKHRIQAVFS